MPLDKPSWERLRLAWNKLKALGNRFRIDRKPIDESDAFDAELVPNMNRAWDSPAIGDQRVRGMIEYLVTQANDNLRGHLIDILIKKSPQGTIEKSLLSTAELDASAAPSNGAVDYDDIDTRDVSENGLLDFDPVTDAIIAFALKEGLPLVVEQVKKLAFETGVEFRQGYSDLTIRSGERFQMWIGQTDDSGSLWVNGTRVGGPVGINTGPFTFEVGRHLKQGGNVIFVECDNSGRGKFSVAFGFFRNGQPTPRGTKWTGDDQLAMRRWFFSFNVFVD